MALINLHQKPENHGKEVVAIVAASAVAGAVAAALTTPKSGKDARSAINNRATKAGLRIKQTFKQAKHRLPTSRDQAKEAAQSATTAAKTAAAKAKTTASKRASTGTRTPTSTKKTTKAS